MCFFRKQQGFIALQKSGQCSRNLQRLGAFFLLYFGQQLVVKFVFFIRETVTNALFETLYALHVDILCGRHLHRLDGLTNGLFDSAQQTLLARRYKQDGVTGRAGSAGTANAMDVGLNIRRDIVIDDMADAPDVQSTCHHIGRDKNIELAFFQALYDPLAHILRNVTIECCTGMAARFKFFGKLHGRGLGAHEHKHGVEVFSFQYACQRIQFVKTAHRPITLSDGFGGGSLLCNLDDGWIVKMLFGDLTDLFRHGRREQCDLTGIRRLFQYPLNIVDKAHA